MGQKGGEHITSVHINLDNSLLSFFYFLDKRPTKLKNPTKVCKTWPEQIHKSLER